MEFTFSQPHPSPFSMTSQFPGFSSGDTTKHPTKGSKKSACSRFGFAATSNILKTSTSDSSHANMVLSSLRDLREQDIVRDFTINVGDESFKVHRAVLAACSQYFRAMFSHDTKERQESTVNMEGVDASAVRECINFMYSGEANVIVDTAGDVLHAASIMQLEKLTEACFEKIEESLNFGNCLEIASVLEIYACEHLQNKVENCIRDNFDSVIKTEKFALKSLEDFQNFVEEFSDDDESSLEAIKTWIMHDKSNRTESIDSLLPLIKLDVFPSDALLQQMLSFPLINDHSKRLNHFIKKVFSSSNELNDNLTIENCFIVKQFATIYEHITKEALDVTNKFLIDNFEQVLIENNFVNLAENDVLMILRASNVEYLASEEFKWNAVMKWVKHDSKRTQLLPELLKTVDFSQFTNEFIRTSVRQEPMVRNSAKFVEMLMDYILSPKPQKDNSTSENVAVLCKDGTIRFYDVTKKAWSAMPGKPKDAESKILSFNNKLCVVTSKSIFYFGKSKNWIRKTDFESCPLNSKVIVLGDCIYWVSSTATWIYNTLRDTWNKTAFGCHAEGAFAVCTLDGKLYCIDSKEVKMFSSFQTWVSHGVNKGHPHVTSIAGFNGKIYGFTAGSVKVKFFDNAQLTWRYVKDLPGIAPHQIATFVLRDRLLIATCKTRDNTTLYAYDDMCDSWMTLCVLPTQATKVESVPNSGDGFSFTAKSKPKNMPNSRRVRQARRSFETSDATTANPTAPQTAAGPIDISAISACSFLCCD